VRAEGVDSRFLEGKAWGESTVFAWVNPAGIEATSSFEEEEEDL
jgi:hypothetical protein